MSFEKLLQKISQLFIKEDIYYVGGAQTLPPPLSPEEEDQALLGLKTGDNKARSLLIEHNLRLVVYIAKKFENTGVNVEDLTSIGAIGLIKAVNTYNTDKQIRLATYASRCIENEILMYLRKTTQHKNDISIDEPLNFDSEGNELLLSDILGTDTDEIIDSIDCKIQAGKLHKAIKEVLTPREQKVIILRYGLDGYGQRPQREIAKALNISRSYVSRIEKKALEKLKVRLKTELYF